MTDYSSYNILIVDDVPLNLMIVSRMLGKYNFRMRTANGGKKALEEVAAERPDLILLDIMMPDVDGFEVLRRLHTNPKNRMIPVIVLSALNTNDDIVRAYSLGAKDFITKPILMEKLINSVSVNLKL
ncbi:MAG: response regulator [Bacteroidales bacterium]|nr:response regulator [Bacteroidales bacterium]